MINAQTNTSKRADELAHRILQGAKALQVYVKKLSDEQWDRPVDGDGRTVGVVVHHVASAYPVEIELAHLLASGQPIKEVTMGAIDQMNADHARENASVGMQETLELLQHNSQDAANNVRQLSDADLDNAATVSLNADAPLTTQFFIEDHALRHSFHHLSRIQATLSR
jgi:hypothetical protein